MFLPANAVPRCLRRAWAHLLGGVVLLGLGLWPLVTGGQQTGTPPRLVAAVTFERQTIRENDCIPVQLHLANESDQPLTDITVRAPTPDFLHWKELQDAPEHLLRLGSLKPHSALHQRLVLRSDPWVRVGEHNLPFIIEYGWRAPGRDAGRTFSVLEKPLEVGFFGSDSIAGIPLGLAGLFVPGLAFWLVLRAFRFPWLVELPLGEKAILSILPSVSILILAGLLGMAPTLGGAISLPILLGLCFGGAALGTLGGVVYQGARGVGRWKARRNLALAIQPGDTIPERLEKLLRLSGEESPQHAHTLVQLENGQQYVGSLAVRDPLGNSWLAGWFLLTIKDPHLKSRVSKLLDEGKVRKALLLVKGQADVEFFEGGDIRGQPDDKPTNKGWMEWKTGVHSMGPAPEAFRKEHKLLELRG